MVAFDHPKTFAEFYEREPEYVAKWLRSKRCPDEVFEDFHQDLLLHLMTAPGPKSEHYGKPDWISTYMPERMGGFGTRWAFAAFVNRMLITQYGKLINRNNRGGVRGPHVASLESLIDYTGRPMPPRGWTAEANPSDPNLVNHCVLAPADLVSRVYLDRFVGHVETHLGQDHVNLIRAMEIFDSPKDAGASLGLSSKETTAYLKALQTLAQDYNLQEL